MNLNFQRRKSQSLSHSYLWGHVLNEIELGRNRNQILAKDHYVVEWMNSNKKPNCTERLAIQYDIEDEIEFWICVLEL